MSGQKRLILMVWFHVAWLGCVFLAKNQLSWVSLALPVVSWLLLTKWITITRGHLKVLVTLATVGMAFDAFAIYSGQVIVLQPDHFLLPFWLMSMWLLFTAVLPIMRELFKKMLWPAIPLGAIFGPLSYYSGKALGVLEFNNQHSLLLYALFWSIYFPVCFMMQRKFV